MVGFVSSQYNSAVSVAHHCVKLYARTSNILVTDLPCTKCTRRHLGTRSAVDHFCWHQVPSKEGDGGAGATGNAPAEKKDKGQARRERRAAAAAAAATAEASGGGADAEEGAVGVGGSVGAYVHISRISDERVEHVDKSYKTGQKVPVTSVVLFPGITGEHS